MTVKPFFLFAFAAALLLPCTPGFAHHGAAAYDSKNLTTLKGTVTNFEYKNPHTQIFFDVTDADGTVQKWIAEGVSVASMARDGWTKNTLKPGDGVTITGNVAKNGSHSMRLSKILLPTGKEYTTERGEDYADQ